MLGALFGFLQPLALPVLDFFKDKRDQKHELDIMQLQMQREKQLARIRLKEADKRLEEAILTGASTEMVARLEQDQVMTGSWVDGLRASVRPTITYVVFVAYLSVKGFRFALMNDLGDSVVEAAVKLWGPEDWELMMYVITYWFGDRTREKWLKHKRG